jgi:hypothetical protein
MLAEFVHEYKGIIWADRLFSIMRVSLRLLVVHVVGLS